MARSTTQRMIDAGLLTEDDVFDANWGKLMGFAQNIGNRGAWRLNPAPPPLNFTAPQQAYQSALSQSMKQNLALKELERSEALKKSLAMIPGGDPSGAHLASLAYAGPDYVPGVAPFTTSVSPLDQYPPRAGTEAAATTPFMGAGQGKLLAPWETWTNRFPPHVPQGDRMLGTEAYRGGLPGSRFRDKSRGRETLLTGPNRPMKGTEPDYAALEAARGPGFMGPEAIAAAVKASLGPTERDRQLAAAARYKRAYPAMFEQSRFPPALRGMPDARLISAIAQSHPLKALDYLKSVRKAGGNKAVSGIGKLRQDYLRGLITKEQFEAGSSRLAYPPRSYGSPKSVFGPKGEYVGELVPDNRTGDLQVSVAGGERVPFDAAKHIPRNRSFGAKFAIASKQMHVLENKLDDYENAFQQIGDYTNGLGATNKGLERFVDRFNTQWKTAFKQGLSKKELALAVSEGRLQALLGKFRVEVVGPGVMTEIDAQRVISALGGEPGVLQNIDKVKTLLKEIIKRKRRSYNTDLKNYNNQVDRYFGEYGWEKRKIFSPGRSTGRGNPTSTDPLGLGLGD